MAQRLAEVLLARGRRDEGLRMLADALHASSRAGDGITVAHARLQLAVHDTGRYGSAADAARAALPVFQQADDQLGLARSAVRIAQELQLQGRHAQADALLAKQCTVQLSPTPNRSGRWLWAHSASRCGAVRSRRTKPSGVAGSCWPNMDHSARRSRSL